MKAVKYFILPFILITLVFTSIIVANSQNYQPIFSVQSVSSQQISETELQQTFILNSISGNVFYLLKINATFDFPQDTTFTGVLNMGCGIGVDLVNTTAWQVINIGYFCPAIRTNATESAGTYNSVLHVYLNTIQNYTDTYYPKTVNFNIHSTMNNPEYQSDNYTINLTNKVTNFSQNQSSISQNLPVNLLLAPFAIFALIKYRKNKK